MVAIVLSGGVLACADEQPSILTPSDMLSPAQTSKTQQKADQWTAQDAPNLFSADLEYRLDALPREGEAASSPWAGNYWPVYKDSINDRWAGEDTQSPAAKFGQAFELEGIEDAVSNFYGVERHSDRTACTSNEDCDESIREKCAKRHGQEEGRCIPTWWGICHAWAPVSILEAEPAHPVTRNGVTFEVNDIKALLTLGYDKVQTRFVSLRCDADEEADAIEYDGYGRPTGDDIGCKDTNPGTYHVLLANYLGIRGESFVEDRTFDDEVWNQPLRAFRVNVMDEVSPLDANLLVGAKAQGEEAGITTETHVLEKGAFIHLPPIEVIPGNWVTVDIKGIERPEDNTDENEDELADTSSIGPGDADLFVRLGAQPTKTEYDCRPNQGTSDEHCEITIPEGTTQMHVALYGFHASHVEITITRDGLAGISEKYIFNEEAAKLYHVLSEVDYIAESEAHEDGHLGEHIGRYTRTDRYEYILEVDKDGKVFGGEWVGDSKRDHPDFLWLPTSRAPAPIAGGAISWSFIKSLLDESLAPENPADGIVTFREVARVERNSWQHFGPYNATQGEVLVEMTGSGDADLYVRKNVAPTTAEYDCRPYQNGSEEHCNLNGPGAYYVSVHGYAKSEFEFRISVDTTPVATISDQPPEEPSIPDEDAEIPPADPTNRNDPTTEPADTESGTMNDSEVDETPT